MRNLSILLLLLLATFAAWILASALLLSLFHQIGQSYHAYFGLFIFPDLISLGIYAVLGLAFAWFSCRLFTSPAVRVFRGFALGAFVLLFLWIRGCFIVSNFRFAFLAREIVLALVIAAVVLCGFYLSSRSEHHI